MKKPDGVEDSRRCLVPLVNPGKPEVEVWLDQHRLPRVKVLLDLQQQLFLCTQSKTQHGCFSPLFNTGFCVYRAGQTVRLTVHRYTQEEPVGDVHHSAAQQTQDVHIVQAAQAVQVSLCGGATDLHSLLQTRTGQGWGRTMKNRVKQININNLWWCMVANSPLLK